MIGCFVSCGMFASSRHPPHLHSPSLSQYRPSCLVHTGKCLSLTSNVWLLNPLSFCPGELWGLIERLSTGELLRFTGMSSPVLQFHLQKAIFWHLTSLLLGFFTSQSEPQCDNLFVDNSSGAKPRDGMSARFYTPAQCLQQLIGDYGQTASIPCHDPLSNTEPLESLCSRLVDKEASWG